MRPITEIIVHCTASPEGHPMTVKQIDDIHRNERHWANGIGYHKVIYLDGTIHDGRPLDMIGAHCNDGGHNRYSIGVVYVGGCAKDGKTAKDTRTPEQKVALANLLEELHKKFPNATLYGHRELVCNLKKKDSHYDCTQCKGYPAYCRDAKKSCPSFDVHELIAHNARAIRHTAATPRNLAPRLTFTNMMTSLTISKNETHFLLLLSYLFVFCFHNLFDVTYCL